MRNAFFRAINEIADKEKSSVFLTADLGYKLFDNIKNKHPNKFYNAGISETNMIGVAAGLALEGLTPVVYSIIPFITFRCLEQIRNDIIYNNLNVKIVGVGAGFGYGVGGSTHHAIDDIGIMKNIPEIGIISPSDPKEAYEATHEMFCLKKSIYLRLGRGGEKNIEENKKFQFSKGNVLINGTDICIISYGTTLDLSVEVCKKINNNNLSCCLISMPTIKPIDEETIERNCVNKKLVVVIEEHSTINGLSSSVIKKLFNMNYRGGFKEFSIPDVINNVVGDQNFIRESYGLSVLSISSFILGLLNEDNSVHPSV